MALAGAILILVGSAVIVLIPGSPLGLITVGVQVLAGVLLPSATLFLLLLCNDRDVLGPWVNGPAMNLFTSGVIAVLVILSLVLTTAVLFPNIGATAIVRILIGGAVVSVAAGCTYLAYRRLYRPISARPVARSERSTWRMPPLTLLAPPKLSIETRFGLAVLWVYLLIAMVLVVVRVVQLAVGH